MLGDFSRWLYKVSNVWITLLGVGIFLIFTSLVLPGQAAKAEAYTGETGSPDTSFFYTPDELYGYAEAFGEAGRIEYLRARFTFDLVWPLVYTLFLATSISWTVSQVTPPGSRWRIVNLVPVLGMSFDYLENLAASLVMWRYPATTPVVEWLAPVFSLAKWVLIAASFLLLFIGILARAGMWVRRRVSSPT